MDIDDYSRVGKRKSGRLDASEAHAAAADQSVGGFSPATWSNVSRTRCIPTSRPVESYHSWSECAPPELPPAPRAIAGIPKESGILASVEDRSMRARLPR